MMELPAAGAVLLSSLLLVSLCAFSNASQLVPRYSVFGRFVIGEENLAPWASGPLKFSPMELGPIAPSTEAKFPLVLAEKRTKRPDILSKFRLYKGGWDITNRHYWASVAFTGATGFILAALWFVSFGMALVAHQCCRLVMSIKDRSSYRSDQICLILLLVFTCATSTGCILLSVGQDEFHSEVLSTLTFVVNQSDFTVQTLRNVTEYLLLAKTINVDQVILPSEIQRQIDKLNVDLDAAATTLSDKTTENSGKIKHVFDTVRCALIVIAAAMLLLALLGFLLSFRGHQHAIYIFVLSGWLLVAVTFVLSGVFVILNNTISDACTAMDEWAHNPQAETALTNILPCVDERTSNRTLYQSKEVVFQLVNVVNTAIETIANSNAPGRDNSFYYNQSGPPMPSLCSPYDYQMGDRPCEPQEVSFANASSVWQNYTCAITAWGYCASVGRITPDINKQLVAAVNVSYALSHYTPLLLNLQDCNFVRETFDSITSHYCPPLEHDLGMVNAGLVMISVGVMLCLILWIIYANRPRRVEVFAKLPEVKIATDRKIPTRSAEVDTHMHIQEL